jgi:outer membrane lipoprotein-sorting protein
MKNNLKTVSAAVACLILAPGGAWAAGAGPTIGSPSDKLFGSNVSYSATMEVQTPKERPVVTRVFVDQGKVRHELDMAGHLASQLPPGVAAQMHNSGLGKQILLWLPEENGYYQIQPGTRGYLEMPMPAGKSLAEADYKLETTELGKEAVNGQACAKTKAVVTDPQNRKREFVVWFATDLNNFPIKIQTTTALGESQTTLYRDVKLAKPDAKLFELPAGYRKYSDIGAMMQDIMAKQLSAGM